MIARVWRGWTVPGQADAYEALLRGEIFPGIFSRQVPGFKHIDLFRRDVAAECEFMTVMWFDSAEAIAAFAGADSEAAYVPDKARAILARFDQRAAHYTVRERRDAAF